MIELKKLKTESIPTALEMARNYRLLNEPDAAESICLDILAVAPRHQETLITLILALTDKFSDSGLSDDTVDTVGANDQVGMVRAALSLDQPARLVL